MRFKFTSYAVAALVWLLSATLAHAQSLTLTPAVVPLKGSLGQSVTQVLTLQNDTDSLLDFAMVAQDVIVRDGARVFVEAGALADSIAATAVFTPRQVHVGAHSSATVTVTLTLPAAVRHRAVVAYFRGSNPVPAGDRKARLSLGTLFTFTVSERISVAAGELEVKPPSASTNAQILSTLHNDGEEPVVPTGMAVILNADGRLAGKIPFPARRLLPGEKTTLVADYPGELLAGTYRAVATFDVAGHPMTLTGSVVVP
jgi:hypothetical protein